MKKSTARAFWILTLAALWAAGCATTGVNKGDINLISVDQEIAMGQDFSREIAKTYPMLDDVEVTSYFQRLGERIARSSDWPDLQFHFQVVNTADVNAFAIPGGWVYVHRGLIERADNVSEVACVMAHEIGHVVARHGTETLTKQYGIAIVTQLVLGQNPKLWQKVVADLFTTAGILAYSRKQELEADDLGVRYAYRAGYDPNGMATFFEKLLQLQEREPTLLEVWFSTHPPTSQRIERVRAQIASLQLHPGLVKDDPEFLRVRDRIRAMPAVKTLRESQAKPESQR
jgi:predicted Zn-dependent protease